MSKLFNNTTSLNELLETIQNKAAGGSGIDTSDATATTATILSGYTAYVKGEKITGTIAAATQATPSITVSSSGLITASATQTAGYVTAGTKNATKQLTTKAATTYTPGTSNQTIASSTYLTGKQTIKGDSNLVASNIKKGVSIFGVSGSLEIASYEEYAGGFSGNAEVVVEGFNVTFSSGNPRTTYAFYSLDNGATWVDIIDLINTSGNGSEVTINGVSRIKLKSIYKDGLFAWIRSTTDGIIDGYIDLGGDKDSEYISENYILTKDVYLVVFMGAD